MKIPKITIFRRCQDSSDRFGSAERPGAHLCVYLQVTQSPTTIIHLFDMSRGLPGSTLSKKSGNYVAKIVLGTNRTEQIIVTRCG